MSSSANFFLKKTLGEDFMESLTKGDLWKPATRSVTDLEDIHLGLKIVPRTIMSFLIRELTPMKDGEHKDIDLPLEGNCRLRIDKHGPDVFSGDLEKENKKITEFKFRSIPGVGLVVMSNFELYDNKKLTEETNYKPTEDILNKVQKMIDDRLALHDLIGKVVDKKLSERDAVQQLVLAKLSEELKKKKDIEELREIQEKSTPQEDPYFRGMTNGLEVANAVINDKEPKFIDHPKKMKKSSPLGGFLEERKNKLKKNEHHVQMAKNQNVSCPDCGQEIFKNEAYSGCICMGENMDSKVYITKSEDGVKVRFGKGWDQENIELLLDVLRGKRG